LVAGHCVGVTGQCVRHIARSGARCQHNSEVDVGLRSESEGHFGQIRFEHRGDHSRTGENSIRQFGSLLLSRPDKLRATRTGGYADIELVFDGETATVLEKNINAFAQFGASDSIDQLVDRLRNQLSVELPSADLLLTNAYDVLMSDVIDAKHIGQGSSMASRASISPFKI
jgi:hypothetical protein